MVQNPLVGQGSLIINDSQSRSETAQSVGLVWTSDQRDVEISTWQNITLTKTNIHATGGIRTRNPRKRAAVDPRLTWRGHCATGIGTGRY
jgi:hypothetical protein